MKHFFFLLLLMVTALFASCKTTAQESEESSRKPSRDLSTDEKVLVAIKEETGYDVEKRDVCIVRPEPFEELILVGFFAHDRGCAGSEAFFYGDYVKPTDHASEILKAAGWDSPEKRTELALSFTNKVLTVWESVVNYDNPDLEGNWFEPICKEVDGKYVVECWVQRPSGMTRDTRFYALRVTFDKSGNIESTDHFDTHTYYFEEPEPLPYNENTKAPEEK